MKHLRAVLITMAIATTVFWAIDSRAQSVEKRITECAAIEGELDRLACYDALAADLGLVAESKTVAISGAGKWKVDVETNPLDDSKTVVLFLNAEGAKSSFGENVTLVLRCQSNTTEVYISWNDYLGSEAYVTTRIGNEKAEVKQWGLSTTSQATFYPDSDTAFILQLLEVDKFVAQVTPYSESPVTAVFDVRGLAEAIKPLRETCGW